MHAQTRRQREVLDFVARYIDSHGYRPSYQVIARHMGVRSRSGIARIVHDLEQQGLLTRRRENGHFYIDVGYPAESAEDVDGVVVHWLDSPGNTLHESWENRPFHLPEFMLAGREPSSIRAFRIPDNAFEVEQICEDDIALIELKEFPRDSERVVAVLNRTRAVLRKFYRAGSDIELCTPDEAGEVIRLPADKVEIKGVFCGLLRPGR